MLVLACLLLLVLLLLVWRARPARPACPACPAPPPPPARHPEPAEAYGALAGQTTCSGYPLIIDGYAPPLEIGIPLARYFGAGAVGPYPGARAPPRPDWW